LPRFPSWRSEHAIDAGCKVPFEESPKGSRVVDLATKNTHGVRVNSVHKGSGVKDEVDEVDAGMDFVVGFEAVVDGLDITLCHEPTSLRL